MGKIRVKTLGAEELEKEQKKRDEHRREVKRAKKQEPVSTRPPGGKGGERIKTVGPSAEELEQMKVEKPEAKKEQKKPEKQPKTKKAHTRSKRFIAIREKVDRNKLYSFADAVAVLKDTANTKFTASIEAHFNLTKKPKELKLKADKKSTLSLEKKFPLAHAKLGSVSDTDKVLQEQFDSFIKKIGSSNIKKVTLSSTMGPGVKVGI